MFTRARPLFLRSGFEISFRISPTPRKKRINLGFWETAHLTLLLTLGKIMA